MPSRCWSLSRAVFSVPDAHEPSEPRSTTVLFAFAAGLAAWSAGFAMLRASDLYWHLAAGRLAVETWTPWGPDPFSFTTAGARWVRDAWLSDLLLYGLSRAFGVAALVWWKWAAVVATFVVLFAVVRRLARGSSVPAFLAVSIGAATASPFLDLRPQLHTYLCVAVLMHVTLGRPRPSRWLPLLFLAWANLHGGYLLGLIMLPALLVPAAIRQDRRGRIRTLLIGLCSAAATLLNPNGPLVVLRAARYFFESSSVWTSIGEWRPVSEPGGIVSDLYPVVVGVFVAAAITAVVARFSSAKRPLPAAELLVGALALALSLRSRRFVVLFAIAQALMVGPLLAGAVLSLLARMPRHAVFALGLLVVAFGVQRVARYPLKCEVAFHYLAAEDTFPVDTLDFAEANSLAGRAFVFYGWGGYVSFRPGPASRRSSTARRRGVPRGRDARVPRRKRARARLDGGRGESGAALFLWPNGPGGSSATSSPRAVAWLHRDAVSTLLVRRDGMPAFDGHPRPDRAWSHLGIGVALLEDGMAGPAIPPAASGGPRPEAVAAHGVGLPRRGIRGHGRRGVGPFRTRAGAPPVPAFRTGPRDPRAPRRGPAETRPRWTSAPPRLSPRLLTLVAAAALCAPLFMNPALPNGSDVSYHAQYVRGFAAALREGVLFPRWIGDLNRGYGGAVFTVYPPLPYCRVRRLLRGAGRGRHAAPDARALRAPRRGLVLRRRPHRRRSGARLARRRALRPHAVSRARSLRALRLCRIRGALRPSALVPLAAPVPREGLARVVGRACRLARGPRPRPRDDGVRRALRPRALRGLLRAARAAAGAPPARSGCRPRRGSISCAAFLVPLAVHRRSLHLDWLSTPHYRYARNFLWRDEVAFGYLRDVVKPWAEAAAAAQAALAAGALAALFLAVRGRASARGEGLFLAILGAAVLVLQTPLSAPLWGSVPLLEDVQFPWRFSGLLALLAGLLFALAAGAVTSPGPRGRRIAAAAVLALSALPSLLVAYRQTGSRPFTFTERVAAHPAAATRVVKEYIRAACWAGRSGTECPFSEGRSPTSSFPGG